MILLTLLAVVITLLVVVGCHELGHALMARHFSVKIKRISIGFLTPLLSYQSKSGIQWTWSLLPLGGYVDLLNSRKEQVSSNEVRHCLDKQSPWKRILIYLAGPLANFIMAFLALTLVLLIGVKQYPPIIEKVEKESIAALAGIKPGDTIKQIGGDDINTWPQIGMVLIERLGTQTKLSMKVISKQGEPRKLELDISDWQFKPKDRNLLQSLGIKAQSPKQTTPNLLQKSLPGAMHYALEVCFRYLSFYLIMIKQLVLGNVPFAALLGPLVAFKLALDSMLQGFLTFLVFLAIFNIAVGFINLLPFPGLDGGSIVYTVIEKIRGKPVSVALEVLLMRLAVIVFCVLLVHLLMNDVARMIGN